MKHAKLFRKNLQYLNLNRSQLVRQALAELLQQLKQQEFELFLAEGYREMAKENTTIIAESLPIQAAATKGAWKWDE